MDVLTFLMSIIENENVRKYFSEIIGVVFFLKFKVGLVLINYRHHFNIKR